MMFNIMEAIRNTYSLSEEEADFATYIGKMKETGLLLSAGQISLVHILLSTMNICHLNKNLSTQR